MEREVVARPPGTSGSRVHAELRVLSTMFWSKLTVMLLLMSTPSSPSEGEVETTFGGLVVFSPMHKSWPPVVAT